MTVGPIGDAAKGPIRGFSLLTADDLHLFHEGSHTRLWERLGAHPASPGGLPGTNFAVFAPEAESVSIVVLDPDRQGEAARIARWDFDRSAMRQLLTDSSGRDIKLEVPWPAAAPAASRLKLFVRYETSDGRRLQADREIFVTPPARAIGRWSPRSTDRQAATQLSPARTTEAAAGSVRSASADVPATPLWSPNR